MVTTSTTILAFKWPSALTAQLVVSIRHIEDPAPHGLGGARVPLAEGKHKRTRSRNCDRDGTKGGNMNTIPAHAALPAKNISSPYMCMHRRSAAWCLTAHDMSHSAQYLCS